MRVEQPTESLPDQLSSIPRIDDTALLVHTSVDALCGALRNQGLYVNPGQRVPTPIVVEALQAELDAGRSWPVMRLTRVT